MNPQTVYLLQAVWDTSDQKNRILEIARNSILLEIERSLKGALDERTIYISPQAKEAGPAPAPTDTGSVSYVLPPVELPDHYIT